MVSPPFLPASHAPITPPPRLSPETLDTSERETQEEQRKTQEQEGTQKKAREGECRLECREVWGRPEMPQGELLLPAPDRTWSPG